MANQQFGHLQWNLLLLSVSPHDIVHHLLVRRTLMCIQPPHTLLRAFGGTEVDRGRFRGAFRIGGEVREESLDGMREVLALEGQLLH
jgi:hypothetical protein